MLPRDVHACERVGSATARIVQDEAVDHILEGAAGEKEDCDGFEDVVGRWQALAQTQGASPVQDSCQKQLQSCLESNAECDIEYGPEYDVRLLLSVVALWKGQVALRFESEGEVG